MYVLNMYNQMPRRMLGGGEGRVESEKPVKAKMCCKQSLEESMIVSEKVHGCGTARMEVAHVELWPDKSHR